MLRKFAVIALLSLAVTGWAAADDRHEGAAVKIMTQNMDDGTDQTYIIGALLGAIPGLDVPSAVDLTYYELQFSAFELRAAVMAAEIAAKNPEIVAVQEAALWRTGTTPGTATDVLFDQIDLLVSALRSAGVPYDVVAVNHLSDLALPGNVVGALRFTDRNALLVRSDLRPPAFHLSNVHARTFDAAFTFFPGLTVPAGWISADVHMGNRQFRVVTTHLETPIAGIPEATDVQMAQARELIHALRNLTIPVVICGDFNSDALHGGFVDDTPTVGLIEAAGYTEVWPATHAASDPGLTWPYYLEDQFPGGSLPPPFFAPSQPFERIDLFFSKELEIVGSGLAVAPMPALSDIPSYASDHAGVVAVFRP
jgi:endonuclease/exonuclease/phosphatase family metal-dependent hydrolase